MRAPHSVVGASLLRASAAILALFASSCSSSGWYDHRFAPAPIEAAIGQDETAGSQVRALVTVIGIAHGQDGKSDHAVIRVRLENIGTVPAAFVPEMASLLTADLTPFGPPEAASAGPNEIAPGSAGQFDIAFGLPQGRKPRELDLSGLNFRFTVAFGAERLTTGMTFQRVDWNYYDPYPRVQVGVGFGVSSVH